jgi:hypothetical protein
LKSSKKPPDFSIKLDYISQVVVSVVINKISVKLVDEETLLRNCSICVKNFQVRVLESPVTIERMGITEIKKLLLLLFYDGFRKYHERSTNRHNYVILSLLIQEGFATVANCVYAVSRWYG